MLAGRCRAVHETARHVERIPFSEPRGNGWLLIGRQRYIRCFKRLAGAAIEHLPVFLPRQLQDNDVMVIEMSGKTLRRRWGEIDVRSEPAGEFGLQATAELMQSAGELLYPVDDKGVALLDELSDSFTVGDEGLAPFARPRPVGHGAAEI